MEHTGWSALDWARFVLAVAMFAVGIGGIVLAFVSRKKWKRAGLIHLPGVKGTVELSWRRDCFPLIVWAPFDTPVRLLEAVEAASKLYEGAIGKECFLAPTALPAGYDRGVPLYGHVEVRCGGNMAREDHGKTEYQYSRQNGAIMFCVVTIPIQDDEDLYYPIVAHELGHALGLADEVGGSVMHPSLHGRSRNLSPGASDVLCELYRG